MVQVDQIDYGLVLGPCRLWYDYTVIFPWNMPQSGVDLLQFNKIFNIEITQHKLYFCVIKSIYLKVFI